MKAKTIRICAGAYEITDGQRTVDVSNVPGLGWVAAARWCRSFYTDPVETKRRAVKCAMDMLGENKACA